mmetsp:Transcript_80709/g.234062  ORF Transcript_80709/g.234062 Transcript_80709/m.234062 type:complete len:222 (-) Transcript_80709:566-1231(-)
MQSTSDRPSGNIRISRMKSTVPILEKPFCETSGGPSIGTHIPKRRKPDDTARLIIKRYRGSKMCNGHSRVGKVRLHTKTGNHSFMSSTSRSAAARPCSAAPGTRASMASPSPAVTGYRSTKPMRVSRQSGQPRSKSNCLARQRLQKQWPQATVTGSCNVPTQTGHSNRSSIAFVLAVSNGRNGSGAGVSMAGKEATAFAKSSGCLRANTRAASACSFKAFG